MIKSVDKSEYVNNYNFFKILLTKNRVINMKIVDKY